jgi:hypothetical protein
VTHAFGSAAMFLGSYYSGWDAYALGAHQVARAAGLPLPVFFRASEVVPARREFLHAHPAETRSRHIFGDHTSHVSYGFLQRARTILRSREADAQEMISADWPHATIKSTIEEGMILEMRDLCAIAPLNEDQYCYACDKVCSTWDVPNTPDACVGIIAGTCCYDFSKYNQQRKKRAHIVSDTIIPWLVFAFVMMRKQPNFIIEECVPDSLVLVNGMILFLGSHWDVRTLYLEPTSFGNPQTGLRRFTVYRNMAKRFWSQALPHPVSLFETRVVTDLTVFYGASDEDVVEGLRRARIAKGFHSDDTSITWKDTLPTGHHKQLIKFLIDYVPQLDECPMAFHCDQTPAFGCVQGPLSRRLLRRTVAFHIGLDRLQMPCEAMLQMGMPALIQPWRSLMLTANPTDVREVAGNGLLPMVFSAVFVALLTTGRA